MTEALVANRDIGVLTVLGKLPQTETLAVRLLGPRNRFGQIREEFGKA